MNKALQQGVTEQAETWPNPMGTDGFEFIEYAAPDIKAMGELFGRMGFKPIARHRHKNVVLYRQGGINFIINAEPDSFAQRFARLHGPSVCAIAFRVKDAKAAYERFTAEVERVGGRGLEGGRLEQLQAERRAATEAVFARGG